MTAIPKDVAMALKALSHGKANEGQQKTALEYILFAACRLRDPSYVEGEKPLTMAYNEGRRAAGLMIAGAIQASPASVRKMRQEAKP